jgi:hypothetical protein
VSLSIEFAEILGSQISILVRYYFPILAGCGRIQTFLDEWSPNLSVVRRGNSEIVVRVLQNKLF